MTCSNSSSTGPFPGHCQGNDSLYSSAAPNTITSLAFSPGFSSEVSMKIMSLNHGWTQWLMTSIAPLTCNILKTPEENISDSHTFNRRHSQISNIQQDNQGKLMKHSKINMSMASSTTQEQHYIHLLLSFLIEGNRSRFWLLLYPQLKIIKTLISVMQGVRPPYFQQNIKHRDHSTTYNAHQPSSSTNACLLR